MCNKMYAKKLVTCVTSHCHMTHDTPSHDVLSVGAGEARSRVKAGKARKEGKAGRRAGEEGRGGGQG